MKITLGNRKEDFLYHNKEEEINKGKKTVKKEEEQKEELFCICKQPDDGLRPMIECDLCNDWYHFSCVNIDPVNYYYRIDVSS